MPADLRARILSYLHEHHVLSLATTATGGPWAASVFYVAHESLSVYFISAPDSRHVQELTRDPRVAVTINPTTVDWASITGIQAEGLAEVVANARRPAVEALYLARFPAVAALLRASGDGDARRVADRFAKSRFYCFTPARLRLIDNRLGFGHREELLL